MLFFFNVIDVAGLLVFVVYAKLVNLSYVVVRCVLVELRVDTIAATNIVAMPVKRCCSCQKFIKPKLFRLLSLLPSNIYRTIRDIQMISINANV